MAAYRVALTGNIASGKSAVAAVWVGCGAALIDADVLAREAVEPGTPGLERVIEAFGPGLIAPDGRLDRAALREQVFADDAKRAALEAILHPLIERLRAERETALAEAGVHVVVHVIPLLFEVGLEAGFDEVVLVDAPAGIRQARLVESRGLPADQARRMIEAQMPAAAKRAGASIVIDNAGTLDELETKAREAWKEIESRAATSR